MATNESNYRIVDMATRSGSVTSITPQGLMVDAIGFANVLAHNVGKLANPASSIIVQKNLGDNHWQDILWLDVDAEGVHERPDKVKV